MKSVKIKQLLGLCNVYANKAIQSSYEILGVDRWADVKEIERAMKRMLAKYHPDVNSSPDAVEKFNEVMRAGKSLIEKIQQGKRDDFFEFSNMMPEGEKPAGKNLGGWGWPGVDEAPPIPDENRPDPMRTPINSGGLWSKK